VPSRPIWDDPGNWDVPFIPPLGNGLDSHRVIFNGGAVRGPDLNRNFTINRLEFSADLLFGEQAFTLQSNYDKHLTIGSGGIVNATSLTQRIDHAIVLGADQTWAPMNGNLVIDGARAGSAALTITAGGQRADSGLQLKSD